MTPDDSAAQSPDECREFGFETKQLHAGHGLDREVRARAVPIYQSTSFQYEDFAHAQALGSLEELGFSYSRTGNPTCAVLERRIAALEGGTAALAVGSGSAATAFAVLNLTHAGDEIVAASTLYGGSFTLFQHTLPKYGVHTRLVDPADLGAYAAAITERTKAVFVETIGNPDINVVDLRAIAELAHAHGLPLIVDNTFATPYLCRPIEHGANVVVHSATKFIGGHGTSIGGLIVDGGNFDWTSGRFPDFTTPDRTNGGMIHAQRWADQPEVGNFAFVMKARLHYQRDIGAALSPFNAFLFLQGLETLSLRMERQTANAQAVAEFLAGHPQVAWVAYPGLPSSPYHELARTYLPKGAGAILGFGVRGGQAQAQRLIDALQVFSFLANVGDSKSLVAHPATVTHGPLDEDERQLAGVLPEQIRLSVGTESLDDLLWDLEQALAASVS